MPIPQFRLFFDTSVYIAALLSPNGAAGELIRLVEAGVIKMVICERVIIESDKVLGVKFPKLIEKSRQLWLALEPEMVSDPSPSALIKFNKYLDVGDALILCCADQSKVSAFVTWNTRDFMAPVISSLVDFPILVPGDCLKLLRKWMEPYIDY